MHLFLNWSSNWKIMVGLIKFEWNGHIRSDFNVWSCKKFMHLLTCMKNLAEVYVDLLGCHTQQLNYNLSGSVASIKMTQWCRMKLYRFRKCWIRSYLGWFIFSSCITSRFRFLLRSWLWSAIISYLLATIIGH